MNCCRPLGLNGSSAEQVKLFFNVLWAAVQIVLDKSQYCWLYGKDRSSVHSSLDNYLCAYQEIWQRGQHPGGYHGYCFVPGSAWMGLSLLEIRVRICWIFICYDMFSNL